MIAIRNLAFSILLVVGAAVSALAQNGPGPGDGPPPPAPRPPAPRVDAPPRLPDPSVRRGMTIPGRLITGLPRLPDQIMEVRIETSGRARIAFAYTDGTGEFAFRDVRLQPSELYYIVIEEEGFAPYRERLDDFVHRDFGGYLALFLEPEARAPEETGPGGAPVVDIGQLLLDVPDDVRQDFEEARELSDEGRHREAAERLEDVVARVPEFYEAFEALGASYLWLERFEDARTALVRAHDLSPRSPGPLLNLGTVLYRQGESFEATGERERAGDVYGQSVDVLRGAIDRDPFSGPAYLRLGAALYKLGELEEAEIALLRALELSPELGDARLMLVNVYVRQLKFDEALIQVDLFREANPDSPYATALAETRLQIESQLGPAGP